MTDVFLVPPGTQVKLAGYDPGHTGAHEKKRQTKDELKNNLEQLQALQQMLWAESKHALLIVLQAMDAGGKDGTIRHFAGFLDINGIHSLRIEWIAYTKNFGHTELLQGLVHSIKSHLIAFFQRMDDFELMLLNARFIAEKVLQPTPISVFFQLPLTFSSRTHTDIQTVADFNNKTDEFTPDTVTGGELQLGFTLGAIRPTLFCNATGIVKGFAVFCQQFVNCRIQAVKRCHLLT